jgi:hypothetical protein
MAFNGAFTAAQQSNNSDLLFTDTSTGTDGNLTERRIFPYKADGTLLLPTGNTTGYISWPIASSTLTVAGLLAKDYALSINVVWVSSNPLPSPSTYTAINLYGGTGYIMDFSYSLAQQVSANPNLLNDNQFQTNWFILNNQVTICAYAISPKQSIVNAQAAMDRAQYLIQNANKFF